MQGTEPKAQANVTVLIASKPESLQTSGNLLLHGLLVPLSP